MAGERIIVGMPDYAGMVQRSALRRVLCCSSRGLVVISAPAGYGKTVLASQTVSALEGSAVWLGISGASIDPARIFEAVCNELRRWGSCRAAEATQNPDGLCRERFCVAVAHARPLTIVLDDIGPGCEPCDLLEALSRLRAYGPSPDAVVITTREDSPEWLAALSPDVVIGADSLQFSHEETAEAMGLYCGGDVATGRIQEVVDLSKGHAATVAVLARQAALHATGTAMPSMDLSAHLAVLAKGQLGMEMLETLCALSMLSSGSVGRLESCLGRSVRLDLRHISSRIPLVQYPGGSDSSVYGIHALASAVYSGRAFVSGVGLDFDALIARAISALHEYSDHVRMFQLVQAAGDCDLAVRVLLRCGAELIAAGGIDLILSALELVPVRATLMSPRLLLLQAEVLREKMEFEEAMGKATVARDLAEIEDDRTTLADALMLLGRLQIDRGLIGESVGNLERVLGIEESSEEARATAASYLALCHAFLGNHPAALASAHLARRHLDCRGVGSGARVRAATSSATIAALVDGRWADAVHQLSAVRGLSAVPTTLLIQSEGNYGTALIETGRVNRAEAVLESAIACSERYGLRMLELSYRDSMSLVYAARGEYGTARTLMEESIRGCSKLGDRMELSRQYSYLSMFCRSAGWHEDSLRWAEHAMEEAAHLQCPWLRWMGGLELAASFLLQGESRTACRQVQRIRAEATEVGSARYVFTADLILAAGDMMANDHQAALARLVRYTELIQGDHSNYLLMMYVRAFPMLLSALASMGEGGIPERLIRYTPSAAVQAALEYCESANLPIAHAIIQNSTSCTASLPRPQCQVRLFGGLDVRVGERVVRERDWRKRKARMLFALMVLERGRDTPREQMCDLLWPNLDAERARNNFYVIWSIMKGALAPGGPKGAKLEFADNTGGLCRIDLERVDSDVELFARTVAAARSAEKLGDYAGAVSYSRSLLDIYRGDLLPGDIYDDCFSIARNRYRFEFCDAMRRAVSCAEAAGETAEALLFARRGLEADPLSEDLYQALMRCHIVEGRRAAAIETYFTCRTRLCDDLGLDPSSDTMRLYEQILAMDEAASEATAHGSDLPEGTGADDSAV